MTYNRSVALRAIHERTHTPHLRELLTRPGLISLHRITCYYADGRARHSIATLFQTRPSVWLELVYEGIANHKPLRHDVRADAVERFILVLNQHRFDKLPDQPDIPATTPTIWQIERAVGGFYHAILLTPHTPVLPYSALVNAIDAYLPESIREIRR